MTFSPLYQNGVKRVIKALIQYYKIIMASLMEGLMGLKSDGTIVHPAGGDIVKLPMRLASFIQRLQHHLAVDGNGNRVMPPNSPLNNWRYVILGDPYDGPSPVDNQDNMGE